MRVVGGGTLVGAFRAPDEDISYMDVIGRHITDPVPRLDGAAPARLADLIAAMILKPAARQRFEARSVAEQRALISRLDTSADSAERRRRIQELVAELTEQEIGDW